MRRMPAQCVYTTTATPAKENGGKQCGYGVTWNKEFWDFFFQIEPDIDLHPVFTLKKIKVFVVELISVVSACIGLYAIYPSCCYCVF